MLRRLAVLVLLASGCHVLYPRPAGTVPEAAERSGEEAAAESNDHLALAAACIERGDDAGAVPHMRRHVEAFPEQIMIRAYLAELLTRLRRDREARQEFERFAADAQDDAGPARRHLIHCHTRLMELAQNREDAYAEHLHRGLGLCELAAQHDRVEADAPERTEQFLLKAIRELESAGELRPREARPWWHLYECWRQLQQGEPARKCLRRAQELAPFAELTAAERRGLREASR